MSTYITVFVEVTISLNGINITVMDIHVLYNKSATTVKNKTVWGGNFRD